MDTSDRRALRLLDTSASERAEAALERQHKRRQELNGCGCLTAMLILLGLSALAFSLAYQLFLWLRY